MDNWIRVDPLTDQALKRLIGFPFALNRRCLQGMVQHKRWYILLTAGPAKFEGVSVYSPCLFGKRIVVHARQACKQQINRLSETKLLLRQ